MQSCANAELHMPTRRQEQGSAAPRRHSRLLHSPAPRGRPGRPPCRQSRPACMPGSRAQPVRWCGRHGHGHDRARHHGQAPARVAGRGAHGCGAERASASASAAAARCAVPADAGGSLQHAATSPAPAALRLLQRTVPSALPMLLLVSRGSPPQPACWRGPPRPGLPPGSGGPLALRRCEQKGRVADTEAAAPRHVSSKCKGTGSCVAGSRAAAGRMHGQAALLALTMSCCFLCCCGCCCWPPAPAGLRC